MAVRVGGGAVEEPEDLRDVVLVHAQVVKPSHVLVAERLVFRRAQAELAGNVLEVRELCLRLQRPIMRDYVTLRRSSDGAVAAGGRSCRLRSWDEHGRTFEDLDGYRVVLQNSDWTR